MNRKSFKERAHEQREQEILHVATRLMSERGYSSVTMDDIAAEVGVSKPTLYRHFPSKEEMVARSMTEGMLHMEAFIPGTTGTPIERLEQIMRHILQARIAYDSPASFAFSLARDQVMPLLYAHHRTGESMARINQQLDQIIDEGRASGQIAPDLPNTVIISAMLSLLGVMDGEIMIRGGTTPEALIDPVVRLFLRGIAPLG